MNMMVMRCLQMILLVSLVACSVTDTRETKTPEVLAHNAGYKIVEPVKGVRNYRVDGWRYLSDQALMIDSGVQQRYLITLLQYCSGLRSSNVIATTSTTGELTKFDSVIVGRGQMRCPIKAIYKLEKLNEQTDDGEKP